MLVGQLIRGVHSRVATRAERSFVRAAHHRRFIFLTDIALNSHRARRVKIPLPFETQTHNADNDYAPRCRCGQKLTIMAQQLQVFPIRSSRTSREPKTAQLDEFAELISKL